MHSQGLRGEDEAMNYYIAIGDQQRGPFPREHLLAQGLQRDTLVWMEGMPRWQRADTIRDLIPLFAPPAPVQPVAAYPATSFPAPPYDVSGTKIAAGIFGIILGALGIHKFIIGATGAGVTMLLISLLTCGAGAPIMHVIGIVEGIIYLTRPNPEFYQTYILQKKAWF
jgi:TM2 domain-containing membrane protein YozV